MRALVLIAAAGLSGCATVTVNGVRLQPTTQAALIATGAVVIALAARPAPADPVGEKRKPEDGCDECKIEFID